MANRFYIFLTIVAALVIGYIIFDAVITAPQEVISNTENAVYQGPNEQASSNDAPAQFKAVAERISIDARSDLGELKLGPGLSHGFQGHLPEGAASIIEQMRPNFWAMKSDDSAAYQMAKKVGAEVELNISDLITYNNGGYENYKPWEDWVQYEEQVRNIVQSLATHDPSFPASVYWRVWNEPDAKYFWSGSKKQLLELYKRTHNVIRSIAPDAKLVGPDYSYFDENFYQEFLTYLYDNDLKFAAISWHEFENPEKIPEYTAKLRRMIDATFTSKPELSVPEIHVNEYAGPFDHLIPGWAVGWFYYFTEAQVDWISRGCWDVVENGRSWSDCWTGFNGVLTEDNRNPQGMYWVHKAFADMRGQSLQSASNNQRVVALATRNDSKKQIRILAGRFFTKNESSDGSYTFFKNTQTQRAPVSPKTSAIMITHYPYEADKVTIRITIVPNEPAVGAVLESDLKTSVITVPVSANGTITLPIEGLQDGEAYIAVISAT